MIAFVSSEMTRAICFTMIAEAYGTIRDPILLEASHAPDRASAQSHEMQYEIIHISHLLLYKMHEFMIIFILQYRQYDAEVSLRLQAGPIGLEINSNK